MVNTRKVNVDGIKDIEETSKKISSKIDEIIQEAIEKANKILNKYNMHAKMQIVIEKSLE